MTKLLARVRTTGDSSMPAHEFTIERDTYDEALAAARATVPEGDTLLSVLRIED